MEKKTIEAVEITSTHPRCSESTSFLSIGGHTQSRYERLRAYVLTAEAHRPRVSPARFDLQRFKRFGLLGLADWASPGNRCRGDEFEIQVLPIGSEHAKERMTRLCELLSGLLKGGKDATSGAVRKGIDEFAGEGADDPESACRHHAVC